MKQLKKNDSKWMWKVIPNKHSKEIKQSNINIRWKRTTNENYFRYEGIVHTGLPFDPPKS